MNKIRLATLNGNGRTVITVDNVKVGKDFVVIAGPCSVESEEQTIKTAQKVKEAVNAGLESTMSTIEVKGNVLAQMSDNVVQEIYLFVDIPAAGMRPRRYRSRRGAACRTGGPAGHRP